MKPTKSSPIEEVAVISTNNRYLQNQDHKLYTYSLMKQFNRCHVPILQFAGDGDARFRNHMLTMSAYTTHHQPLSMSVNDLTNNLQNINMEGLEHGWDLSSLTTFDCFHFMFSADELTRPDSASYLADEPTVPYYPDPRTKISFYLGLPMLY